MVIYMPIRLFTSNADSMALHLQHLCKGCRNKKLNNSYVQVLRIEQEFMFEFQGTIYFFKAVNLIGLDKLGGEVRLVKVKWLEI